MMRAHRLSFVILALMLSGCATLPGQRLSLADAGAAVIAANGNADAGTLFQFANGLVRAGNYVQALSVLSGETQPDAPDAKWLNALGICRGELGDKIGARRAFEAALALGSDAARQNLALLDQGPTPPVAAPKR
jgi:hypothetical protein